VSAAVDLERALAEARRIARAAAELLRAAHSRDVAIEHKGAVDLVTEMDRRAEGLIVPELHRAFPEHTVRAEEGTDVEGEPEVVWYVDPLDGTTNYAHHLPIYAVSLGLEVRGEPAVGVVHAPELGWELWAARGAGAHLNGQRLRVSTTATLSEALLATGFPYDRRTALDNNVPEFGAIIRRCQGIRRMGVASIDCACVAQGMFDGYWELKLKPWDVSAGALLVLEAGGEVTDIDGGPYRSTRGQLLATNGRIHAELSAAILDVRR
jgi:myo-inositol-1(or 4)-monophosphatase